MGENIVEKVDGHIEIKIYDSGRVEVECETDVIKLAVTLGHIMYVVKKHNDESVFQIFDDQIKHTFDELQKKAVVNEATQ